MELRGKPRAHAPINPVRALDYVAGAVLFMLEPQRLPFAMPACKLQARALTSTPPASSSNSLRSLWNFLTLGASFGQSVPPAAA